MEQPTNGAAVGVATTAIALENLSRRQGASGAMHWAPFSLVAARQRMSRITTLQAYSDAAAAAIMAGDGATALQNIAAGEAILMGIPDSEIDEDMVKWGRDFKSLKASANALQSRSLGIQRTKFSREPISD